MIYLLSANATESQKKIWMEAKQDFAQELWPMPGNLIDLWGNMTSLVIVRHPMSRLVSAYHDKIIKQPSKYWAQLANQIIGTYRNGLGPGTPQPEEFVK